MRQCCSGQAVGKRRAGLGSGTAGKSRGTAEQSVEQSWSWIQVGGSWGTRGSCRRGQCFTGAARPLRPLRPVSRPGAQHSAPCRPAPSRTLALCTHGRRRRRHRWQRRSPGCCRAGAGSRRRRRLASGRTPQSRPQSRPPLDPRSHRPQGWPARQRWAARAGAAGAWPRARTCGTGSAAGLPPATPADGGRCWVAWGGKRVQGEAGSNQAACKLLQRMASIRIPTKLAPHFQHVSVRVMKK